MKLGKFIRKRRIELNFSQRDLMFKLGLTSSQSISNVERGLVSLPIKHFKAISIVLKVPVEELVKMHTEDYSRKILKEVKRQKSAD